MHIPKTNRLFTPRVQKNHDVARPGASRAISLFTAIRNTADALAIVFVALTLVPQGHAAQLNASGLTGPEIVSIAAALNINPNQSPAATGKERDRYADMQLGSEFLEADISDFAASARRDVEADPGQRSAEFGSVGLAPVGIPLQAFDSGEKSPLGNTASAAAGMPIMVLVWLFGVGLIGMGTVGRRKQTKS